jgi:hypothetical protein
MSLVKKVMTEATAMTEATVKKESTIAKAARTLTESGLATRCPALAKMFESTNKADKYKAAVITKVLNNTAALYESKGISRNAVLKEDVTSSTAALMPGVASLTPRVVDIVNIFYPQMVAHYIADIQALDRQTGEIFIIKSRYGMSAAGVAAGDIIFEKPTDGSYASEWLSYDTQAVAASVNLTVNADTSFAPDPASIPGTDSKGTAYNVRAGSLRVLAGGKEIARDFGTGQVAGKGVVGTIDYATGAVSLTLDAAKQAELAGLTVTAQAARDTEINDDTIRTVEFDILEQPIRAEEHPLMSSYSVASALVANAHMALDVDELISNELAGTIRWERDLALIKKVADAAEAKPELVFDCSANGTNLTLKQRYNAYDVMVSTARGLIQEAMGRGAVEYMIVSATEGLTIVENIDGFVAAPEAKKPVGPYLAGTLRDGTVSVIAVPYVDGANAPLKADEVIFGFKGFQMGDAAVILAEWVPLYFTPTFQAPNLKNHKGCLSFYDLFINQPKYLVKGGIANFNVA